MAQELIIMFNLIKEDLKMKREEIYEAIDQLHKEIDSLKGEYIALSDEEIKLVRNGKFEFRVVAISRDIQALSKLSYEIQQQRYK